MRHNEKLRGVVEKKLVKLRPTEIKHVEKKQKAKRRKHRKIIEETNQEENR